MDFDPTFWTLIPIFSSQISNLNFDPNFLDLDPAFSSQISNFLPEIVVFAK